MNMHNTQGEPKRVIYSGDNLKKKWNSQQADRDHARKKRLMYCNQYKDQLDAEMQKLFETATYNKIKQRQDDSVNLFKWSIDERAGVYSRPVSRKMVTVEQTEDGPIYINTANIDPMPEVDMSLDKSTKWTEATGETLVRPTWQGGRMQCLVYPRDRFYCEPDPMDPLTLILVIIEHTNDDGKATHYEVWSQENLEFFDLAWKKIDRNKEARYKDLPEDNPFGLVPFFVMHYEYPCAEFWHGYASDDLQRACLDMAVSLTDFNHIKHYQSYLLLFLKKDGTDDKLGSIVKTDASAVLEARGPNADAKVLDMQANLLNHLEVIIKKAQFTLGLRGLRPTILHGDTQVESGFALMVREYKKLEYWQGLRQLRTLDENRMWEIARVVIPQEGGPDIPEGELIIEWPSMGMGGVDIEKAQFAQIAQNMVSEEQAIRYLGHNETEVQKILEEKRQNGPSKEVTNLPGVPTNESDAGREALR